MVQIICLVFRVLGPLELGLGQNTRSSTSKFTQGDREKKAADVEQPSECSGFALGFASR